MKKYCNKCKKNKLVKYFHKSKAQNDGYVSLCKNCKSIYRKNFYIKNRKKELSNNKIYRLKNKQFIKDIDKIYYIKNFKKIKQYKKLWTKKNRKRINNNHRQRIKIDVIYKITRVLRSRFYRAFKNEYKGGLAIKYLGCSIKDLKTHLETKFKDNMSWKNYGLKGWHIDHIKPLSKFDLTKTSEIKKACHYTNLQPLWAFDNLSKGSK